MLGLVNLGMIGVSPVQTADKCRNPCKSIVYRGFLFLVVGFVVDYW